MIERLMSTVLAAGAEPFGGEGERRAGDAEPESAPARFDGGERAPVDTAVGGSDIIEPELVVVFAVRDGDRPRANFRLPAFCVHVGVAEKLPVEIDIPLGKVAPVLKIERQRRGASGFEFVRHFTLRVFGRL